MNRDHKSFEWFINLLADLEIEQEKSTADRFLNIRLYMTSAANKNEIKLNAVKSSAETSNQADLQGYAPPHRQVPSVVENRAAETRCQYS